MIRIQQFRSKIKFYALRIIIRNIKSMKQKAIAISLENHNISIDQFKKALGIFNVSKVHLEKHKAVVEFESNKDFKSFQFTNSNNKIVSLNGAIYKKLSKSYQWQFSQPETHTLQELQEKDLDETQTQSLTNEQKHHTHFEKQEKQNAFLPATHQVSQANNATLGEIIKQEKLQQERQKMELAKSNDAQGKTEQLTQNSSPNAKIQNQSLKNAQTSKLQSSNKSYKFQDNQYTTLYAFLIAILLILIAVI